jgi:hypothetical protein
MKQRLSRTAGAWSIGAALLALLGLAGLMAYQGLMVETVRVPAFGYVAMALGVLVSLIIGIGLMALVFYSSRSGYDEPPRLIREGHDSDVDERPSARNQSK